MVLFVPVVFCFFFYPLSSGWTPSYHPKRIPELHIKCGTLCFTHNFYYAVGAICSVGAHIKIGGHLLLLYD